MLIHLIVISKITHQWLKKIYKIVPKSILGKVCLDLCYVFQNKLSSRVSSQNVLMTYGNLSQPVKCVEECDKGSFPRIDGTDAEIEVVNASRFILITESGRSVYIFECLCVCLERDFLL